MSEELTSHADEVSSSTHAEAITGAFGAIASTLSSITHAVSEHEYNEMNRMDGELLSSDWFVLRLGRALSQVPGVKMIP
jgi:hypothetical protein